MRFAVDSELDLFAESVRAAVAGFAPPLEPPLGRWWDERDDALAERLRELGWERLGSDLALRPPAVAGAIELGRVVAPLCLLDEATLGGALCLRGRARHARGADALAVPGAADVLLLHRHDPSAGEDEPTLDGTGTVRGLTLQAVGGPDDAASRLGTWCAATLGYAAGLADAALERALAHVRSREQFGAPLGSLAAVQGRLADAALARDGLVLLAWEAATADAPAWDALAWAGSACRAVTAQALQVHGGIGFALEGGVHAHYRRAKTVQVWSEALLDAVAGPDR